MIAITHSAGLSGLPSKATRTGNQRWIRNYEERTKYFGGRWHTGKPRNPAYTADSKMKHLRSSVDYGYRTNDDGSTDLICLYCGNTVLNTFVPNDLGKAENEHLCDAKKAKLRSAANWNPGPRGGRIM